LPLVSIWKKSIAANSTRLQRLLLRLSQYDIDLQYLRGKDNVIADALSRVSPLSLTAEDKEDSEFIPVHMLTAEFPADAKSIADFRKATYCRRHGVISSNENSYGWVARFKKGLSSITNGLLELQR